MNTQQALSYASSSTKVVGLYFSASYCKYCTTFTPMLQSVYSKLLESDVEIIGSYPEEPVIDAVESEPSSPVGPPPDLETDPKPLENIHELLSLKMTPSLKSVVQRIIRDHANTI